MAQNVSNNYITVAHKHFFFFDNILPRLSTGDDDAWNDDVTFCIPWFFTTGPWETPFFHPCLQKLKCLFGLKGGRSRMWQRLKWKRSSSFVSRSRRRARRRWRCLQYPAEGARGRYPPSSPRCCSALWWCWSLSASICVAGTAVRPAARSSRHLGKIPHSSHFEPRTRLVQKVSNRSIDKTLIFTQCRFTHTHTHARTISIQSTSCLWFLI